MDSTHKVHGTQQKMVQKEGRAECGFESPSDREEHDDVQIRINGGKLGSTISLSYLQSIPGRVDGTPSSHGAQYHPDKCTPCCFVTRAKGCSDGILCSMCHESHPTQGYSKRKKDRVRKSKKRLAAKPVAPEEPVEPPNESTSAESTSLGEGEVLLVYVKNTFLDVHILLPSIGSASVRSRSAP